MSIRNNRFAVLVAFIAAFAGILFGFDTGVISGAILFIRNQFHLSAQMNGLVTSAVLIGAFLGAIFSGHLSDRFGRKSLLIADAIIFIFGTIITTIAPSIAIIIIGRIIVGVAIGIASYTAPLYISEISPPRYRGALVSLNQLAVTIGILIAYIIDYVCAVLLNHNHAWRYMFLSGIVPAVILLLGVLFLPFSPRWLMFKGYEQKAIKTLQKIRKSQKVVEGELARIRESLHKRKGSWRELLTPTVRPTLLIAGGLAIIQQVTGINTILYYAPTIFQISGFHHASVAILATMGVGVVFVLSTIIALPFIDNWGRRPLLFTGLFIMTVALFLLSWVFQIHEPTIFLANLSVVCIFIYVFGFGISLGPVMWLMIAEVFPLRVRGLGSSVATAINWGSNWLVTISFLTLVQLFHQSGTFLIYAVVSLLSLIFIYFIVPETRGVSLETIEANLNAGKKPRHIGL